MINLYCNQIPKIELKQVKKEYPDSNPENSGFGTGRNPVSGPDDSGFGTGRKRSGIISGRIPGVYRAKLKESSSYFVNPE